MKNLTIDKKEEADRNYRNFHTNASWQAFLSVEQVNYILQERGDFIFCNGRGRQVVAELLTEETFKVYTTPA